MIFVTGANGQLGRRVVNALLKQGTPGEVVVGVRDQEKAQRFAQQGLQVRHCDYDDLASLVSAFRGVRRLLFISSPALEDAVRIPQHERVVKAASEVGVGRVVYTSFLGSETDPPRGPRAHYVTERVLEQSGLAHTFLRNPFYTDGLLPVAFLQTCIASGEIKDASGGRAVNSASYRDLAEAAAVVLRGETDPEDAYELTGPLWTFADLAEALRQSSGCAIGCRPMEAGALSGPWSWLFGLIRSGALEQRSEDLGRVLGRPATDIEQYVAASLSTASASA